MSGSSATSFVNTSSSSFFEVAVTNTYIFCKDFTDTTFSDVKSF